MFSALKTSSRRRKTSYCNCGLSVTSSVDILEVTTIEDALNILDIGWENDASSILKFYTPYFAVFNAVKASSTVMESATAEEDIATWFEGFL